MISLGRDLIASMNGMNYPLKRDFGGWYLDGKWRGNAGNEAPLFFDSTAASLQAALRKIPGMTGVVVAVIPNVGFSVTFPTNGAQQLIGGSGNTMLDEDGNIVGISVTRTQVGDDTQPEIQRIAFSEEPVSGHAILSFGPVPSLVCFASQQPLSGSDIVRIPEGDRDRERLKLYSADLLRISKEGENGHAADLVTVNGLDFQVESVQQWTEYWKAVIVRVEPKEEGES